MSITSPRSGGKVAAAECLEGVQSCEPSEAGFAHAYALYSNLDGGSKIGIELYAAVLAMCAAASKGEAALKVLEDMRAAGVPPDEHCYAAALKACRREGRVQDVLALLERMRADPALAPGAFHYNAALRALREAGRWREALELLRAMAGPAHGGVAPNAHCYNTAMQACDAAHQPAEALRVLQGMRARGVQPNVFSYNAVMRACERTGDWRRSLQLFELEGEALRVCSAKPGEASPFALQAASQRAEMQSEGVEPDWHSHMCVLAACRRGLQWGRAMRTIQTMRSAGLTPGLRAYTAAMQTCIHARQWARAADVADMMVADLERDGIASFGSSGGGGGGSSDESDMGSAGGGSAAEAAVNGDSAAAVNGGTGEAAPPHLEEQARVPPLQRAAALTAQRRRRPSLLLFHASAQKLNAANTAWSAYAIDTALYACQRGRLPDRADALLARLRAAGVPTSHAMRNRLMAALESARRPAAVLAALDAMRAEGGDGSGSGSGGGVGAPDAEAVAAAVRACRALGLARRALELVEEAEDASVALAPTTYAAAVAACAQQDDGWEPALMVLARMRAKGVQPTSKAFASAVFACHAGGQWELALELLKQMQAHGLKPSTAVYNKAALACADAAPGPRRSRSSRR
ncbi:hypothetical protein JKP88DRAFT_284116 [Tribonema minus]|uniref:PROP1-like PPR domain-containing protein n=1 Tax=Tribonema minus TaxID=303371 RepID=A0A835YJX1_9STRA|nr:hypothetical protein JKP88DRAFT_284116 [Tribonema minus]